MAAPDVSYTELLQVAHSEGVGFRFRGFEVTSRVVSLDGGSWRMTVAKSGNVWTVGYLLQSTGAVGRIVNVYDDGGQRWIRDDATGGWRVTD